MPLRQAAGRHRAPVAHLRAGVGQGMAADGVDHPRPAFLLQRLARCGKIGPVHHRMRAQCGEVSRLRGLAGGCHHAVAQAGQQQHGHRAHAARGTCHQHLAVTRLQAVPLQGHHAQHRGVARRANGHGLAWGQRRRQRHQPFALEPSPLRQAAPVRLTHPIPVQDERITGLPVGMVAFQHLARAVDAGHHGPQTNHWRTVGQGQAVLVVQRRVARPHQHATRRYRRQALLVQFGQPRAEARFILLKPQCLEHSSSFPVDAG